MSAFPRQMIKAYRFKLEPNRKQKYALARTLDVSRELYNDTMTVSIRENCTGQTGLISPQS